MTTGIFLLGTMVLVLVVLLVTSLHTLGEHERGVVFTLGRFSGVHGPGRVFLVPFMQTMQRVDLRPTTLSVTVPDARTPDDVAVQMEAVIHYHIHDPQAAILQVADVRSALLELARAEARVVVGHHDANEVLRGGHRVVPDLTSRMQARADAWGVRLTDIEMTARPVS